uniref:Uncharacterized protein n=1 Tax=Arundo donax TaxID=35708 RepID=A0A0A9AGQ3_ARUDO
MVLPLSKI